MLTGGPGSHHLLLMLVFGILSLSLSFLFALGALLSLPALHMKNFKIYYDDLFDWILLHAPKVVSDYQWYMWDAGTYFRDPGWVVFRHPKYPARLRPLSRLEFLILTGYDIQSTW